MSDKDAESQTRKRRKRRWVKRLAIGIPVVIVLYIVGSLLYMEFVVYNPGRVKRFAYDSWLSENKEAFDGFRELARANKWRMHVVHANGIGILDFGHSTYDPLYSLGARKVIGATSRFHDGRVVFTECRRSAPWWRTMMELTDFEFRVLERDGTVMKVPLDWFVFRAPIVMGDRFALLGTGPAAFLYDIETKSLRPVFTPPNQDVDKDVIKIALVEGKFLVLLVEESNPEHVLVLEARKPHGEISRMDGVCNVIVVGEHIVVEKGSAGVSSEGLIGDYVVAWNGGACFLYDPRAGTTEHLTAGHLVCSCGDDEFLFCTLDQGNTSNGRGQLYRYTISSRSKELVWEPRTGDTGFATRPGEEKRYDYTRLFLSPDGRFLFIPWHIPPRTHAELHLARMFEYEVYDLTTRKKRGAFVDSFEGKFSFNCLGWVEDEGAQ